MLIRPYKTSDYEQVAALYKDSSTFGGQFDKDRDSAERLEARINQDPESILIAEQDNEIIGTVSLIEDTRVAWLFRFATKDNVSAKILYEKAVSILKSRGHKQVLVYSPANNKDLNQRYNKLGFNKGNDFTAFWQDLNEK